jgi:hypothetical protein
VRILLGIWNAAFVRTLPPKPIDPPCVCVAVVGRDVLDARGDMWIACQGRCGPRPTLLLWQLNECVWVEGRISPLTEIENSRTGISVYLFPGSLLFLTTLNTLVTLPLE